jgi:hypothetical protein
MVLRGHFFNLAIDIMDEETILIAKIATGDDCSSPVICFQLMASV